MSYHHKNIDIRKLSIIGAGQIGPDICLHFAKVFWKHHVELVLLDISSEALDTARLKIEKKISNGLETGSFKTEMATSMKDSILYTTEYNHVAGSNIVLEAATEDAKIKGIIFQQVEEQTDEGCLFFSNSSHMTPEDIFKNITNKSRALVTHYFFPAERNPVVEIVPGKNTDPVVAEDVMCFYESIGKVPIKVKSSYGYAIDPIFEGLCELAILCLEKELGSVKEIDHVARQVLNQGIGPFTALNLTGGNPITNHGLEEMRKTHIGWFRSPKTLQEFTENGQKWDTAGRSEEVVVSDEKAEILSKQFLGGYFALCAYIIDLDITSVNDLDMAAELSLVISPPFTLMNKMGIEKSYQLVKQWCLEHTDFPLPKSLEKAKKDGGWQVSHIVRQTRDNVAILTIRRPKALNALNLGILDELKSELEIVHHDASIKGVVITGFGTKAFVSGADLSMLASLKTPEEGYNNSNSFQSVINYIEGFDKPIVCAMNGFAFGGGNELAMACTARIAKKDLPVLICQPEVKLGFIPGAGGTQRLPRIVGVDKAAEILRTARPVSSKEALEIGLIQKVVDGNLLDEAVILVDEIVSGKIEVKHVPVDPLSTNQIPQEVNIGHLSQKIDSILTRAIYEGVNMPLREGLEFESRLFGECLLTEDMKIGLDNFKKNGPGVNAAFIHK